MIGRTNANSNLGDKLFDNISTPAFAGVGSGVKSKTCSVVSDTLESGTYMVIASAGYLNSPTITCSVQAGETDEIEQLYASDAIVIHNAWSYDYIFKVKLNTEGQITFTANQAYSEFSWRARMICIKVS